MSCLDVPRKELEERERVEGALARARGAREGEREARLEAQVMGM